MCGPTVRAALSFSPLASVGESPIPAFPKGKESYPNTFARGGLVNCPFCERVKYQLRVTPSANRNSYRVAMISLDDTQGSVLRPQPWAGESQLLQSCQGEAPSQPSPRGRSSASTISTFFEGFGFNRGAFHPSPSGTSLIRATSQPFLRERSSILMR